MAAILNIGGIKFSIVTRTVSPTVNVFPGLYKLLTVISNPLARIT